MLLGYSNRRVAENIFMSLFLFGKDNFGRAFRAFSRFIWLKVILLLNRAVKIRVMKKTRNVTEIENRKIHFPKILAYTSASSDNLLEFGHRPYI